MPTPVRDVIDQQWEATRDSDHATDPRELPYPERVTYWRERIPDGYEKTFETLIGRGCTTRVAAAVCQYLAGRHGGARTQSQSDIAAEFGVSEASIKRWSLELAPPDER
jgi:hypothetical protein